MTGYCLPVNIKDCIWELDKMLPREKIGEMAEGAEREMIRCHFGFGARIRIIGCFGQIQDYPNASTRLKFSTPTASLLNSTSR